MNEHDINPQEVVLRFDSAEEVVLRYRQEAPLPDYPSRPKPRPLRPRKRRSRLRGNLILLLLISLLLTAAALALNFTNRPHQSADSPNKSESGSDETIVFTTIPRYHGKEKAEMTLQPLGGKVLTPQQIYETVNPAVVTVIGTSGKSQQGGTGIIFSENGFILTNAHVIEHCESVIVVLANRYSFDAKLVAYDSAEDLAILKIEGNGFTFPTVSFGDSDDLSIGEPAYAIGNPLGIDLIGTFTSGMISGLSREIDVGGGALRLLQTDAALNKGNSGGPLINQYGQVIGINTAKILSNFSNVEGIGFAIPTADAKKKVNDLIEYGKIIPTPVIGITVAPLVEEVEDGHLGLDVWEVTPEGPGALAGLQPYDIVIAADGRPVLTNDELLAARDLHKVGDTMELEICRGGEHFTVTITLQGSK